MPDFHLFLKFHGKAHWFHSIPGHYAATKFAHMTQQFSSNHALDDFDETKSKIPSNMNYTGNLWVTCTRGWTLLQVAGFPDKLFIDFKCARWFKCKLIWLLHVLSLDCVLCLRFLAPKTLCFRVIRPTLRPSLLPTNRLTISQTTN